MCAVDVREEERRGRIERLTVSPTVWCSQSAEMAAVLCYPYGVSITCVCDNSGSVYNCYPTNYKNKHSTHINNSPLQVRDHTTALQDYTVLVLFPSSG